MSHMVIYRSADGKPKYQQVDDLQAAVTFVEKLRNEEGLEGSKIFRLEQVNYRFEPYYQVKVDVADQPAAAVPPPPPVTSAPTGSATPPVAPPPEAPVPAAPVVDLTSSATTASPTPTTTGATESAPTSEPVGTAEETETNGVRRGLFGR